MGKYLVIIGLLMNSALIVINRFIKRLPDALQLPLMILGIIMMFAGAILTK